MHMSNALLSPAVATVMCAASAVSVGYSIKNIKKDDLCEKKIPVMGVMGAFVFAAQMINFTIPATGSSGHIGGGILLAAVMGGFPALLSIAAVLIIQCLFFADGGLLALGCNIFNMGVIPCLVIYPLIFEPIVKKGFTVKRITAASIAAVAIALQLGAFAVVAETSLSNVSGLAFDAFLLLMQPVHLAIGITEGAITAGILCFVYKMRPEIMESTINRTAIKSGVTTKKAVIILAALTLITGGLLSLFASSYPDGLEWSIEKTAMRQEINPIVSGESSTDSANNDKVMSIAAAIQEKTAFMPDYEFKGAEESGSPVGTSVAGIAGGLLTFFVGGATALAISAAKKRVKKIPNS